MWQRLHGPASPQPLGSLTRDCSPSPPAADPRGLWPSPLPPWFHHSTSRDRGPNKTCRSERSVGCVSRRTVVLSAPAGAAAMSAPIADDMTTEAPAVRAKPPAGDGDLGKMRAHWCAAAPVAAPGPWLYALEEKLQQRCHSLACNRACTCAACLHRSKLLWSAQELFQRPSQYREGRRLAHAFYTGISLNTAACAHWSLLGNKPYLASALPSPLMPH